METGSRLDEQSTQKKNINLGDRDQSRLLAILQFRQHHSPPRPSCIVARRREKRRQNNPTKCIPKTIGGLGAQSGENLLYNPAPGHPAPRPMVLSFGVGRGCTCTPVERRRKKEAFSKDALSFPPSSRSPFFEGMRRIPDEGRAAVLQFSTVSSSSSSFCLHGGRLCEALHGVGDGGISSRREKKDRAS